MAMAVQGNRERVYLAPSGEHIAAARINRPNVDTPECRGTFGGNAQGRRYGFKTFGDYFTNRQLRALTAFTDLIREAHAKVKVDAARAGLAEGDADSYADAVATYLAFAVSKYADYGCSLAVWYPQEGRAKNMFARHAIPMVWDFPEINPLSEVGGSFIRCCEIVSDSLSKLVPASQGSAGIADARSVSLPGAAIATDPPYYDNISYADVADFFYVWLRRSLASIYPELFQTVVTPKILELISNPYRHGGSKDRAADYFEQGFVEVFRNLRSSANPSIPLTFFYAFKQAEGDEADGVGSTGWSTMLEGLAAAGWMVTATWPMRTERGGRSVAIGTNALASSVLLACRPRAAEARVTDRRGLIRALQEELRGPLRELQKANIAPVDLRQAAIGPGMAVFSRFAKVIEPSGSQMRVRTALGIINQALDQVLGEQEQDFDDQTRWAIQWFSQFFFDEGPYGVAEQLAVSMNVAVSVMVEAGIIESGAGKVRLLAREELSEDWDPVADLRTPVWEVAQHLVKRLEEESEGAAARLLRRLDGLGDSAQLLAYRLFTICEQARPSLAGPFNALVASWPEIQRLARMDGEAKVVPEQQTFGT